MKERKDEKTLSDDASALHFWHDRRYRCRAQRIIFLHSAEPGKLRELKIIIISINNNL